MFNLLQTWQFRFLKYINHKINLRVKNTLPSVKLFYN